MRACQGLPARTVTQNSDIDMCLLLLPALLVSFLRNPWQIQHDNVCIVPSLFIFVSIFSIFGHKDCNVWEGKVLTSNIKYIFLSIVKVSIYDAQGIKLSKSDHN